MNTPAPRPFLPADRGRSFTPPGRFLERAVAAHVIARGRGRGTAPQDVVRALHGDDEASIVITRAAVSPATTTGTGWAAEVAGKAVADFVLNLPQSAASKLFAAGLTLPFDGVNQIKVPRVVGALPVVPFIDEAAPAPAVQLQLSSVVLGPPGKMMISAGFTGEVAKHSAGEAVITTVLQEASSVSLDGALFSTTAASAIRPAGLLAGVTPLSPAAGTGQDTTIADLQALIGAVAAAGGTNIVVVAGTSAAAAIGLRLPDVKLPVWPSLALAADTVIAIDASAFVAGFSPVPRIDTTTEALVHFEDTTPAQIGTAGTPNVVAAPARSAFQTDVVVLRLILNCAWAMREPRVAFVPGVNWA